ncbi:TIGR02646 family protein [Xenococcus sp. PCC 7305]|uniref:retron system putative HNH endonuclease n=1 Tax=Xenococcus sp. PCC 7305 TaxID=102125 RepID=UPI0002ABB09A|nr:retron system putative HNH endonuclease [Xenococcus sp. PCC 7305]ELS02841.1 TIGR02646 family protein [Xenococcus sp. PCC 7305]
MKYIKKNQPPQDFIQWKNLANEHWQPNWDNFQKPQKSSVHKSLLKEQGLICCYCGRRINQTDSHIEHLKPRNKYPDLTLDYINLIASCQGKSDAIHSIPVHCGHKKGEWYEETLMVSPLDENCTSFFRYTDDGQILATADSDKQTAAEETIKRLALDVNKLKKMREKAIEGILDDIDLLSNQDLNNLIDAFENPSDNGVYEEFCSAIVYVLRQYL